MSDFYHPSRSRKCPAPGFTLIELIVAIALAALMLTLINFIFNDTARAVSQGIALSDIIGNERGAGQQFQLDADAMLAPDADTDVTIAASPDVEGGVLAIVHHLVNDIGGDGVLDPGDDNNGDGVIDPNDDESSTVPGGPEGVPLRIGPDNREIRRLVRSDQLMFMRNRVDGANTILPLVPETSSTFSNDFADAGGDEYFSDHVMVWYGHARKTGNLGITADNLGVADGDNEFANNWLLARKANFLVNGTAAPGLPAINANSARFNARLNGYNSGTTPPELQGMGAGGTDMGRAYHGTTDTSDQVLGATTSGGSILNYLVSAPNYQEGIYNHLFLAQRLWANPTPEFDPTDAHYSYTAWQYAQMHPALINNVSDFIVEFAADATGATPGVPDGAIDRHAGFANNDSNGVAFVIPAGGIVWYTSDNLANDPNVLTTFDSTKPETFPLPAVGIYRNNVYNAVIPAPYSNNGTTAFVWRHDDQQNLRPDLVGNPDQTSFWPYLIRIRYRVHDSRGRIESGDGQHGIWFEHIIRVNRP